VDPAGTIDPAVSAGGLLRGRLPGNKNSLIVLSTNKFFAPIVMKNSQNL
jgi:hypothetical protein